MITNQREIVVYIKQDAWLGVHTAALGLVKQLYQPQGTCK